jgi:hypothetical protein
MDIPLVSTNEMNYHIRKEIIFSFLSGNRGSLLHDPLSLTRRQGRRGQDCGGLLALLLANWATGQPLYLLADGAIKVIGKNIALGPVDFAHGITAMFKDARADSGDTSVGIQAGAGQTLVPASVLRRRGRRPAPDQHLLLAGGSPPLVAAAHSRLPAMRLAGQFRRVAAPSAWNRGFVWVPGLAFPSRSGFLPFY